MSEPQQIEQQDLERHRAAEMERHKAALERNKAAEMERHKAAEMERHEAERCEAAEMERYKAAVMERHKAELERNKAAKPVGNKAELVGNKVAKLVGNKARLQLIKAAMWVVQEKYTSFDCKNEIEWTIKQIEQVEAELQPIEIEIQRMVANRIPRSITMQRGTTKTGKELIREMHGHLKTIMENKGKPNEEDAKSTLLDMVRSLTHIKDVTNLEAFADQEEISDRLMKSLLAKLRGLCSGERCTFFAEVTGEMVVTLCCKLDFVGVGTEPHCSFCESVDGILHPKGVPLPSSSHWPLPDTF